MARKSSCQPRGDVQSVIKVRMMFYNFDSEIVNYSPAPSGGLLIPPYYDRKMNPFETYKGKKKVW